MTPQVERLRAALAVLLVLCAPLPASAQRTPLYQVDLERGTHRDYLSSGDRGSASDLALDALLDETTDRTFSGKDLEQLAGAIKRYLGQARPRAMPRMMLFLYPGRISKGKIKELREVKVDIELLVDPCGRAVCADAMARHLEVLGQAMRTTQLGGKGYRVTFETIRLRRRLDLPGADFEEMRFSAAEVVTAGKTRAGGRALIKRLDKARSGYEQQVSRAIQKRLKLRRLRLTEPPRVARTPARVSVALKLRSDRVRCKGHVLRALAEAGGVLRKNELTPAQGQLKVTALVQTRGATRRVFTCDYRPLTLHIAGRLSSGELWTTYVVETSKKGRRMTFDDSGDAPGASAGGEDRTQEILAAHMSQLAPCLQAEAVARSSFKGATLRFVISPGGRAERVSVKEREAGSVRLLTCLKRAVIRIRFPARAGAPRQVEYPMFIQR